MRILVIGDLMIGRGWVVTPRISETVQAHAGIVPRQRIRPERNENRIEGAGLMATAICRATSEELQEVNEVEFPQAMSDTDEVVMIVDYHQFDHPLVSQLLNNEGADRFKSTEIVPKKLWRLGEDYEGFTTIKFRIYEDNVERPPRLLHRFDQDPPIEPKVRWDTAIIDQLEGDFEIVVISDFNKGAISSDIWNALVSRYCDSQWFIDSKNPLLGSEQFSMEQLSKRPFLFPNREELYRLYERSCEARGEEVKYHLNNLSLRRELAVEEIVNIAGELCGRFRGCQPVFVTTLDRDGAVAVWDGEDPSDPSYASVELQEKIAAGVGAGDHFMAGFIRGWLRSSQNVERSAIRTSLECGAVWANAWLEVSEGVDFWVSKKTRYMELPTPRDISKKDLERVGKTVILDDVGHSKCSEAVRRLRECRQYSHLISGDELNLSAARGFLGNFITADRDVGERLHHFRRDITEYVDGQVESSRPLNCLICVEPGFGRMAIASEIAKEIGSAFYDLRLVRLPTLTDLTEELAVVATDYSGSQTLLLLFNEVDTRIQQEHVYPMLLSVLQDGKVSNRGKLQSFDCKLINLLLVRGDKHQSAESFLEGLRSEYSEMETSINGPVLTLHRNKDPESQELRHADRLYLIATLFKRTFKDTIVIERGVLDALVRVGDGLSPHHLEQIVSLVQPYRDGRIRTGDLRHRLSRKGLLNRYVQNLVRHLQADRAYRSHPIWETIEAEGTDVDVDALQPESPPKEFGELWQKAFFTALDAESGSKQIRNLDGQ